MSVAHLYPPQSPFPLSRPITPHASTPLSAPPTPITPTHILPPAMERARSTEGVVNGADHALSELKKGQEREPRSTNLKNDWAPDKAVPPSEANGVDEDDRMDVDDEEGSTLGPQAANLAEPINAYQEEQAQLNDVLAETEAQGLEDGPSTHIWGMPKWGRETERREVHKGVRLLGMEELPNVMECHSLIDTPSSVMFPWLHGISDDGQKGQDMAQFFGCAPPFEPPPYRGLCLLFCPPHSLDYEPHSSKTPPDDTFTHAKTAPYQIPGRKYSEGSASSESYRSTGTTVATSPSLGDSFPSPAKSNLATLPEDGVTEESTSRKGSNTDVAMHPCDSKRLSPKAVAKGLDEDHHPLPCPGIDAAAAEPEQTISSTSSDTGDSDDGRPTCILSNALYVHDVFELPSDAQSKGAAFKTVRLPDQINLRNLNIQQIKYATVSDIIIYSKGGLGPGMLHVAKQIAQAQEELYQQRKDEFYRYVRDSRGPGEGNGEPVKYGVWILVEPFHEVEKHCPELVTVSSKGSDWQSHRVTDLFEREAIESRAMTRGSEVVEGFWVGNDCDVPGVVADGASAQIQFDLCLRASECAEIPSTSVLAAAYRKLREIDRRRDARDSQNQSSFHWPASPASAALRSLLSPPPSTSHPSNEVSSKQSKQTTSPTPDTQTSQANFNEEDHEYVGLECSGSSRTVTGMTRNLHVMVDRVIELVYFLRRIIEGRDLGRKRRVLVHCQDGYTESSIIVLSYIMSSLSVSLPEAFLHLQVVSGRSFFLYPADKPLLREIDARLSADRRAKASKLLSISQSPPNSSREDGRMSSPGTKWRSWGMAFGGKRDNGSSKAATGGPSAQSTVEVAKDKLAEHENGGSQEARAAKVWFDDRRFDGFPSRILPFLYLGNLDHAGNAAMLKALSITHVVSVGESLVNNQDMDHDRRFSEENTLGAAARAGTISVLDLTNVRDDGNDPLRPVIARACEWIDTARQQNGKILVHCRVGVSRSASIVIAYMMQYEGLGLIDAYMICRARRLNVLIQPNLRFFHELFGWEVELARREAEAGRRRRKEAENQGVRDPDALRMIEGEKRRIVHSWPSFCRDLYCLNRRFLCN